MGITAAIAMTAVSTGIAVAGEMTAASAKADAERQSAQLKGQQADELMSREAINEGLMRTQESRQEDIYAASTAGDGTGGHGNIGGLLRMQSDFAISLSNAQRDAAFKAKMLRAGAAINEGLASDATTAGYLNSAGTILGGAAKVYGNMKGPTKSDSLTDWSKAPQTGASGGWPSDPSFSRLS